MTTPNLFVSLTNTWQTFFKIAFISILIGLLTGCPANVSKQINYDESKNSQYYLSQYLTASGDEQTDWQLLAIRSLIIEDNVSQAERLINQLPGQLNRIQQQEALLLQGELAVKTGRIFDLNKLSLNTLSDSEKIRYYQIKIGLDKQKNDINALIRDYIELEKYGTQEQRHMTINNTWDFLIGLSRDDINTILVYANEPILQGWIDLIYTYNNNSNVYTVVESDEPEMVTAKQELQFNLLKNAVNEWQMQYSNHSAALYLPRNIYGEKYRLPDDVNKKNVALFLPLSGSSKVFSDAIRLGYFDAGQFYSQEPQQNITIYDTNGGDLASLVKQAEQQGAELIVGPLLKQDVLSISKLAPAIPVLALNKIDRSDLVNNGSQTICYFALSPEDDASDAANHISHQNKTNPLLIVPKNDLGERVAKSFVEQWQLDNPEQSDVYVQYFESETELRNKINSGVGIELEGTLLSTSTALLNQPESLDALLLSAITDSSELAPVEDVTPQFDAIYVYASHNELALIKAMLEMKSNKVQLDESGEPILDKKGDPIAVVKNIPTIYAGSRSNIADATQDFRYDMDRLQFSDIPFIINQSPLMDNLPTYIKNDYSLVRLYAMGFDAWKLANRFKQLVPYKIDVLDGMTGTLSVAQYCEITRTLTWQQYLNGKEVAVH